VSDFSSTDDPTQQAYASDSLYTQLSNQKQVARKLINIRQSSRFSPASTPSLQQSKPSTSSLNRKFSNSSLNSNQFSMTNNIQNDQNFAAFYER
jgi:hypothetical protein